MIDSTITHMCKSARAMGLSKTKWLLIEDALTIILRSSGPEFTIQFLKDLKEAKIKQMVGEPFSLSWHKINSQGTPAGWQKHLWKFAKPKTSIQILGALINSIELNELSHKQFDKWHSGVRVTRDSDQVRKDTLSILSRFSDGFLRKHNRSLDAFFEKEYAELGQFSLKDLTGTAIPVGDVSVSLAHSYGRLKNILQADPHSDHAKDLRDKALKDALRKHEATLVSAWLQTVESCPPWVANMEMELIPYLQSKGYEVKDAEARLSLATAVADYNDFSMSIDWDFGDGSLDEYAETSIFPGLNGQVAFLQQPGGKLRTICNPNRYAQHVLRPLQRTLFNHPLLATKVNSVFDQQAGIKWAQSVLSKGHTLASMDLSAATDLLASAPFIEGFLQRGLSEEDSALYRALEYFEIAAKGNWAIPSLDREISFTEGQPLGLAPSFPLLTLQNAVAATLAWTEFRQSEPSFDCVLDDSFRVVGDDMLIRSELKDLYSSNIAKMGGEANPEKALLSSRYAEFCSQLITPSNSWPLKPKIKGTMDYVLVDLEKSTSPKAVIDSLRSRKIRREISNIFDALSEYSGDDYYSNIPDLSGSRKAPELVRFAVSTYLSQYAEGDFSLEPTTFSTNQYQKMIGLIDEGSTDDSLSHSWTVRQTRFLENLARVNTTGVEIPLKRLVYNHHTGEYEDYTSNPLARYKSLYKHLSKLEIDHSNGSVVVSGPAPVVSGLDRILVLADRTSTTVSLEQARELYKLNQEIDDFEYDSYDVSRMMARKQCESDMTRLVSKAEFSLDRGLPFNASEMTRIKDRLAKFSAERTSSEVDVPPREPVVEKRTKMVSFDYDAPSLEEARRDVKLKHIPTVTEADKALGISDSLTRQPAVRQDPAVQRQLDRIKRNQTQGPKAQQKPHKVLHKDMDVPDL